VYGQPAGLRLLQVLEEAAVDPFTADQAATVGAAIGLSATHVWTLLHHLTAGRRITRLKKGMYGFVDPATGTLRAQSFAIGAALVTPSAVSHWSALQHWGLTDKSRRWSRSPLRLAPEEQTPTVGLLIGPSGRSTDCDMSMSRWLVNGTSASNTFASASVIACPC